MRFLAVTLLAACATPAARPASPASPPEAASTFAPAGEPADQYAGGAVAGSASALATTVAEEVTRAAARASHPVPVLDGRLSAVAEDLARVPAGSGGPPSEAVQFALSYHGLVEPSPLLMIYDIRDGDTASLTAQLETDLPEALAAGRFTRLGVGHAPAREGVTTVVLAMQEGSLALEPVPRELPRGGRARLRGRVLSPFHDPEVFVTGPGGDVADVPLVREGDDGFRADVVCGAADGRLKVEVMAEDRTHNPTVLANFPVWCGEPAPRSISVNARGDVPRAASEVEQELFTLANRSRTAAGLAPLVWDDKAAAVARAHSTEMRDRKVVAHVSPTTGSHGDRARAAGLGSPLLLENLARAQSAAEAHAGLMDSPGHRANLLSPQVNRLGIGVALGGEGDDRAIYATELFFRATPRQDVAELRRQALHALAASRAGAGLTAVTSEPILEAIAQRYAKDFAAGKDKESLANAADQALERSGLHYRAVVTVSAVVGDVTEAVRDAAMDDRVGAVGIGVAQGHHVDLGDNAIFVVMLFGRTR